MTKKDFELIAGVISEERAAQHGSGRNGTEALLSLTRRFADRLKAENDRFDDWKFVQACLPKDDQS